MTDTVDSKAAPAGFLFPSDAVHRLYQSMYGNLAPPKSVKENRKAYPGFRFRSGPQLNEARRAIWEAAKQAQLSLWICHYPGEDDPVIVPPSLVKQLMRPKGGVPDQPYRVAGALLRAVPPGSKLRACLTSGGFFLFKQGQFEKWRPRATQQGFVAVPEAKDETTTRSPIRAKRMVRAHS